MKKNIVIENLEKNASEKQKDFLSKLVPTISKEKILGVKNPDARKVAKEIYKNFPKECEIFLHSLPHNYLEEYIVHTSILEQMKDYDKVIKEIEKVLPYIDNWATCDTYRPNIAPKNKKDFYKHILNWIKSKEPFTKRFGIQAFMTFYLDKKFYEKENDENFNYDDVVKNTADLVSKIRVKSKYNYTKESAETCPDKYYVDMMIAWFFSTLLAKDYKLGLAYIKNNCLEDWTHNKSIQKACESFRVSDTHKEELKKLKRINKK